MNERIIIKNFGPIKEVDFNLSHITLFIGQQATGKSTIAKLIHFFRYITSEAPFSSASHYDLKKILAKFWGNAYLGNNPDAEVHYIYDDNIKITFKNNKLTCNDLKRGPHRAILIPASRAVYSLISNSMFSLTAESVNIDESILLFGQAIENIKRNSDNIFSSQNSHINKLCDEILKGRFTVVNGENRIYFSQDKYISLDKASSGQQEVLPLLLILMNALYKGDKNYITIEEPEAHLYPYTQNKLIKFISQVYNSDYNTDNFFIITTHSPYILTSFNNLLFAYQVANINNKAKAEVSDVIPEMCWISPGNFDAYYVEDGMIRSVYNDGLIADNEIDDASEDIAETYDRLIDIFQTCS